MNRCSTGLRRTAGLKDNFARLQRENLALRVNKAPKAWGEYKVEHEAKVKAWAYQEAA